MLIQQKQKYAQIKFINLHKAIYRSSLKLIMCIYFSIFIRNFAMIDYYQNEKVFFRHINYCDTDDCDEFNHSVSSS